jgi:hypothetical protein
MCSEQVSSMGEFVDQVAVISSREFCMRTLVWASGRIK